MSAPEAPPPVALEATEVRCVLGDAEVLKGATLALAQGEITALLGPSGAGKSSLLRAFAGLDPITAGEIRTPHGVLSTPAHRQPPETRRIGVVFQDFALFPHLTVRDNVAFGLKRVEPAARAARSLAMLDAVGLAHRAAAFPHELSGGEQQRVALARALAPNPDVLLLDEPFSNLDGALRHATRERTRQTLADSGATALIVTHDAEEAMTLADRLALMHEGRIIQTGLPAEVYLDPVSRIAAALTGGVNAWTGRVSGGRLATPFGPAPAPGLDDGAPAEALVRPEGVVLLSGGDLTVLRSRPAGPYAAVDVAPSTGEPVWRIRAPLAHAPEKGERVSAAIDPDYARVLPVAPERGRDAR